MEHSLINIGKGYKHLCILYRQKVMNLSVIYIGKGYGTLDN